MAERRAEILDAAETIFAERGFQATRIDDIAARVGVAHGTIYGYFRSKQELFFCLLLDRVAKWNRLAEDALAKADDVESLVDTVIRLHIEFFFRHVRLIDVGMSLAPHLSDEMKGSIKELSLAARGKLCAAVRRLIPTIDQDEAEVVADALDGAVQHTLVNRIWRWGVGSRDVGPDELDRLGALIKRAVLPILQRPKGA